MSLIYLDACIVIYLVEKHPAYYNRIEALIGDLDDCELCYSPLTKMECLVLPIRNRDLQLKGLYEAFFATQKLLSMPNEVFDEATKLRSEFASLKTPDALHLAAATLHKCDKFWTNDDRLNKSAQNLVRNVLTF